MTSTLDTIDDKYELLSQIGSGGYGTVYRARQIQFSRLVAVKVLQAEVAGEEGPARFLREAQILSRIKHKVLPVFYGYGMWKSCPYMVMELLDGVDLQTCFAEQGRLDIMRSLRIMRQVCEAVACAHVHDVIHRDLKPTNVFILRANDDHNETDSIKVIDFGLARLLPGSGLPAQQLTDAGSAVGTLEYMSPEQCKGEAIDARSDVYSAGCILYQCITGKPPFQAATAVEIMMKQVHERPDMLGALENDDAQQFLQELQRVIDACLAKNPGDRYQNMSNLSSAIQHLEQLYSELPEPAKRSCENLATEAQRKGVPAGSAQAGELAFHRVTRSKVVGKRSKFVPLVVLVLLGLSVAYFLSGYGIARLADLTLTAAQLATGKPDGGNPELLRWCLSLESRSQNYSDSQQLLKDLYLAARAAHVPVDLFCKVAAAKIRSSGKQESDSIFEDAVKQLYGKSYQRARSDQEQIAFLTSRFDFVREFAPKQTYSSLDDASKAAFLYQKLGDKKMSNQWFERSLRCTPLDQSAASKRIVIHNTMASNTDARKEQQSLRFHLAKVLIELPTLEPTEPGPVAEVMGTFAMIDSFKLRGQLQLYLDSAEHAFKEQCDHGRDPLKTLVAGCLLARVLAMENKPREGISVLKGAIKLAESNSEIMNGPMFLWLLEQDEEVISSSLASAGCGDQAEQFLHELEKAREPSLQFCARTAYGQYLCERAAADECIEIFEGVMQFVKQNDFGDQIESIVRAKLQAAQAMKNLSAPGRLAVNVNLIGHSRQAEQLALLNVYKDVGERLPPAGDLLKVEHIDSPGKEENLYASLLSERAARLHLSSEQFVDSLIEKTACDTAVAQFARRFCLSELSSGRTRLAVARRVTRMPEFCRRLVIREYEKCLQRRPAVVEVDFWLRPLVASVPEESMQDVRVKLAMSDEARRLARKLHESYADRTCRVLVGRKANVMEKMRIDKLVGLLP